MRSALKSLIRQLGYEIRRRPLGHRFGLNAFDDQRELLAGAPVETILDVGANAGQTARHYLDYFPQATIHCFEPDPDTYGRLAAAFQSEARVKPHRLAVADADGIKTLFVNRFDPTSSLLPVAGGAGRYVDASLTEPAGRTDVVATRLDEFCRRHGLERIDVLKLDIQGCELMALRGAEGLLRQAAVRLIYTEVLFAGLYEGQAFFHDIERFLDAVGYRLFGIYDLHYAGMGGLAWADAIFLPASPPGGRA
jgi:FkbM family methyltransferase